MLTASTLDLILYLSKSSIHLKERFRIFKYKTRNLFSFHVSSETKDSIK